MQNGQFTKKQRPEDAVDIWRYARALWKRAWLIVLAAVVCAAAAFAWSKTMITPKYQSSFTTYVNNKMEIDNMGSTSVSDLNASYGLAYVYQDIITSRSVVEQAVALCKANYPQWEGVSYKITAAVAEKAPIIKVSVEAEEPRFAQDLAKAIAQCAPMHVERVVEGSSMHIIDDATLPVSPSSPNHLHNVLLGTAIGVLVMCLVLIAVEFYLDKVQGVEDLEKRYEIPVLGSIPDMDRIKRNSRGGGGK